MTTSAERTGLPGNRWDLLAPPQLDAWTPTERVSVILPVYRAQAELDRTLAALSSQRYPRELLEVLVVDDGSEVPIVIQDGLDLPVTLLRQSRDGFGAARARNLGAQHAGGEVLVFLDADMVPAADLVAAHARWHTACDHAVTLGSRVHVEFEDLTPADVATAVATDALDDLLADRPRQRPEWIEAHLVRTDRLRGPQDDLFRVVTSGNLGVGAALFHAVGGFNASFDRWGGEDTELGYRLQTAGGLLVPEPVARCWHQGAGHEPSADERRSLDEQRARLAHLIAHRGFRRLTSGRSYRVPRVEIEVEVAERSRDQVLDTVEHLLASTVHDLSVRVDVPDAHPEAVWLRHQLEGDPRVRTNTGTTSLAVPFRARVPAGVLLAPDTLAGLLAHLADEDDPVGVIRVTVPGSDPRQERVVAWSQRAAARLALARRGATPVDAALAAAPDLDAVAELQGTRWVSGHDLGVGSADHTVVAPQDPHAVAAAPGGAQAEALELWALLRHLPTEQRRAVLAGARDVVGALRPRELAVALRVASIVIRIRRRLRRVVSRVRATLAGARGRRTSHTG